MNFIKLTSSTAVCKDNISDFHVFHNENVGVVGVKVLLSEENWYRIRLDSQEDAQKYFNNLYMVLEGVLEVERSENLLDLV
jgi:hypothetical protein